MDTKSFHLIQELSEARGPSGFEGPVRKVLEKYLAAGANKIMRDNLGSIAFVHGDETGLKLMLAAHMDEIGFMVRLITPSGFIKLKELGSWWSHTLLAHEVEVLTKKGPVTGIIGGVPPHHLSKDARGKLLEVDEMFLDIGATSKEEAEALGVRAGDPVVPKSSFGYFRNDRFLKGKAFDDRIGCALMVEVFLEVSSSGSHPNTLYACGTVQEEVGIRGAATAAAMLSPEVAFVLEGPPADDTPGLEISSAQCALGKGPQIRLYDPSMIVNPGLGNWLIDLASELGIPCQVAVRQSGGTDGAKIHLNSSGVPTAVIGVPVRYAHSHTGIVSLDDYEAARRLIVEAIRRLDRGTLQKIAMD